MNGAAKALLVVVSSPLLISIVDALSTTTTPSTPTTAQSASSTISCDRFRKTGFWDVDIDNRPALPAACGPPISLHALRDKSKLPAQICGIAASYIFCVVVVGIALLTIGRRLRRVAETSQATLEIEMVNPNRTFEPVSPVESQRSWMRGLSRLKISSSANSKASSNPASSPRMQACADGHESIASFDTKVLEDTKLAQQVEMERLFAAVLQHEDEKKRISELRLSQAPTVRSHTSSAHGIESSPPKPVGERRRLSVQVTEDPNQIPENSVAPKSPYKAIYPSYPSPGGLSATSGQSPLSARTPRTPMTPRTPRTPLSPVLQQIQLPNDMYPASPPPQGRQMQLPASNSNDQPPPTPRSFLHRPPRDDDSSSKSVQSRQSRVFKNLRISGPMSRLGPDDMEESQPLSPRPPVPLHPPPPPSPPEQRQVHFAQGHVRVPSGDPLLGQILESDSYAAERLDEAKPLPSTQPQRRPSALSLTLPSNPSAHKPVASSSNTLPFRTYQTASAADPSVASWSNPLSPGPIKTTLLERKIDKMRGPLTARTPKTGVPMTPFSPYMPFTPVTPVTPGLMSRKARKERIKAEGRKVVAEEDVVKDADEMWDDGY